jgi:hypothetical protein
MTFQPLRARTLCALFLTVVAAAPLFAAGKTKQRAVLHPAAEKITVTGMVVDASTGLPIKGAVVSSGTMSTLTDENGNYSLTCTFTSDITASRVGYVPLKKPVSSNEINFALAQTPSVTVKQTNGQTVVFDYDTTKFGYADIFSYVSGDGLNLCKSASEPTFAPFKNEMQKITGPAHPVTVTPCCDRGPIMAIDIKLKTGETVTGYIKDSCFGLEVDVLGVERSSGQPKYIHLKDVTEINFP